MKTNISIVLIAMIFGACGNANNGAKNEVVNTSEGKTDTSSMANPEAVISKNDADFLAFATGVDTFEVQAGKLATMKTTDKKIKDFAALMVKDHTVMLSDVRKLATKKNITLPNDFSGPLKDEWAKLDSLKGDKFDKEYAEFNVKGHQAVITKFTGVADTSSKYSVAVQQMAKSALPRLQAHEEHADMLETKVLAEKK